jgi:hypothetical protein
MYVYLYIIYNKINTHTHTHTHTHTNTHLTGADPSGEEAVRIAVTVMGLSFAWMSK